MCLIFTRGAALLALSSLIDTALNRLISAYLRTTPADTGIILSQPACAEQMLPLVLLF